MLCKDLRRQRLGEKGNSPSVPSDPKGVDSSLTQRAKVFGGDQHLAKSFRKLWQAQTCLFTTARPQHGNGMDQARNRSKFCREDNRQGLDRAEGQVNASERREEWRQNFYS